MLWGWVGASALRGACEKSFLQRKEREHASRGEAEDQTSPAGCKMDQVKGLDGFIKRYRQNARVALVAEV